MHKIRDIGEEFWSEWTSDLTSTDPNEMRISYRVVEIVQVHEYGTHGKLIDVERVEPIKVERRLPDSIR